MFPKIPHPPHTKIAWPHERLAAIDFIDEASRQNTVYGMREFDGGHHPTLYYVRNANQESFIEIHRELRESQDRKVDEKSLTEEKTTSFLQIPRFIRKWMLRAMRRDPFIKKFATGTVGVTSVGMLAPSATARTPFLTKVSASAPRSSF